MNTTVSIAVAISAICLDASTLEGWWRFAENAGSIAFDDSVNGRSATLDTDHVVRLRDAPGRGAIWFGETGASGGRQAVSYASVREFPAIALSNSFTVTAWIRPEALTAYAPIVVQTADPVEWKDGFGLFMAENGALGAFAGGGADEDFISAGTLPTNTWSHVALVCNGSRLAVYIDSREIAAKNDLRRTFSGHRPTTLVFGTIFDGLVSQAYVGAISDVRIWSGALSHSQIAGVYREFLADALNPYDDDDRDGIPNCWELRYGMNPRDARDAGKDNDGDGVSNLSEYRRGGNPRIGVSVKRPLIRSSTATTR